MDLPALRDILVTYFNDGELRDLCFDLGIDYENLGGEGKAGKARELVAYCVRHNRLTDLGVNLPPPAAAGLCRHSRRSHEPHHPCRRPAGTVSNQSGGVTDQRADCQHHGRCHGSRQADFDQHRRRSTATGALIKVSVKKPCRLAQEALLITERSGYVLQGADVHLFLAQEALKDNDKAQALQHAKDALRLATCDGALRPDYTYKVAYDEAQELLKQLEAKSINRSCHANERLPGAPLPPQRDRRASEESLALAVT